MSPTSARKAPEAPPGNFGTSDVPRGIAPDPARAISPTDAWLAGLLSAGSVQVCDIQAAALAAGMAMRTVERAKRRLGIKTATSGRGWCWSLAQGRHEQQPQQSAGNTHTQQPTASDGSSDPSLPQPPGVALWQIAMVRNNHAQSGAPRVRAVPLWMVMGRK